MHNKSAEITPKSNAIACLGPLEKLVSISKKKIGPMKTKLNIKPNPIAENISSSMKKIKICNYKISTFIA